jgi:hypothetical protein
MALYIYQLSMGAQWHETLIGYLATSPPR